MKIGIIGGSGFLGNNLYIHLKKNKKFKIFKFSSYFLNKKNWINLVKKEIQKKKPNLIINCSANQSIDETTTNISNMLYSNLYSNILFLHESQKYKEFKGFISFGTKWELGENPLRKPLNFYAVSKKANEIFYEYFSKKKDTSIISLKIFDTYGPNDKRKKFLNELLDNYKKNKSLNITLGKQYLDYVHIKDICVLIEKIIFDIKSKKLKGFKSFTVSSKKPIQLVKFIRNLTKILDKKLKYKIGKKKYRSTESYTI